MLPLLPGFSRTWQNSSANSIKSPSFLPPRIHILYQRMHQFFPFEVRSISTLHWCWAQQCNSSQWNESGQEPRLMFLLTLLPGFSRTWQNSSANSIKSPSFLPPRIHILYQRMHQFFPFEVRSISTLHWCWAQQCNSSQWNESGQEPRLMFLLTAFISATTMRRTCPD